MRHPRDLFEGWAHHYWESYHPATRYTSLCLILMSAPAFTQWVKQEANLQDTTPLSPNEVTELFNDWRNHND